MPQFFCLRCKFLLASCFCISCSRWSNRRSINYFICLTKYIGYQSRTTYSWSETCIIRWAIIRNSLEVNWRKNIFFFFWIICVDLVLILRRIQRTGKLKLIMRVQQLFIVLLTRNMFRWLNNYYKPYHQQPLSNIRRHRQQN